jgi:hypothetical protein
VPLSQAGTTIRLPDLGLADTTDATGHFAFPGIGPGLYQVQVVHPYYDSISSQERITTRNATRNWVLQPKAGLRGDVNHDGVVTISDILLLVNYVFKSGPAPNPVAAGDANGTPPVTSADIVYLVAYVFKGGPPPPPL